MINMNAHSMNKMNLKAILQNLINIIIYLNAYWTHIYLKKFI